MKIYLGLFFSLSLLACSQAPDGTNEAGETADTTGAADEVASVGTPDSATTGTAVPQQASNSNKGYPVGTFWCEERSEGRYYFYVDPADDGKGMVGLEFSDEYKAANPGETSPGNEMQRAVSGSGMLYVNEQTEFRAKANEGKLRLSDGSTVSCVAKDG